MYKIDVKAWRNKIQFNVFIQENCHYKAVLMLSEQVRCKSNSGQEKRLNICYKYKWAIWECMQPLLIELQEFCVGYCYNNS